MTIDLNHLTANWKSTVQSILTSTFAITGVLMVSTVISPRTAGYLVTVNTICKVVLGVFQTDGIQVPTGSTVVQTSKTVVSTPDSPPASETTSETTKK